ncbi:hypothetical protein, partial [Roseobacter sp.]|uniref:hypothetical protein n=1 Tax=Roseobacter sp. TaxID=1907202 RepID=UPI00385A3F1B
YERLDPNDITETWLAMQSNATAMAIAMFGVHPFPEFLTERLRQMSKIDGATGLMAKRISEIAT